MLYTAVANNYGPLKQIKKVDMYQHRMSNVEKFKAFIFTAPPKMQNTNKYWCIAPMFATSRKKKKLVAFQKG